MVSFLMRDWQRRCQSIYTCELMDLANMKRSQGVSTIEEVQHVEEGVPKPTMHIPRNLGAIALDEHTW